jgi:pyruvate formate lyase activating enzyme
MKMRKKKNNFLNTLKAEQYEIRTVLVPTLIDEKDVIEISKFLNKETNWFFAKFRAENCLDPKFNAILPYDDEKTASLIQLAKTKIPKAQLR